MGASAHVYAAEDIELRRRVAVKILHPALAGEEAFLRRFRAEARAVASLRHPNVLRIYDWGDDGGAPYLVMELLEGGSLRSILDRGGRLSPGQAAAVGAEAARALDYAHRQGIVHRDVKPANLIFDEEGRVSVADFGLARALAEATWTEPVGSVVGTARYAAPELVRGQHLDDRADVYSLALVLVEAVTGTVPFVADTAFGTLVARADKPIPVPDEVGPLKPALEAAGAAEPGDRSSAGELAKALQAVGAKLPLPAPLPLAGPMQTGMVERDAQSPTELPGRPRLFDGAEWDERGHDQTQAGVRPAGVAGPGASGSRATGLGTAGLGTAGLGTAGLGAAAGPGGGSVPSTAGPGVGSAGPRRKRRWLRYGIAVLVVLLLAAGGGVVWAVESGKFTPTHPVPGLVGVTQAVAVARLDPLHFHLQVIGSEYDSHYAKGQILSQSPTVGKLKEGSTVRVTLSSGPQPIPVPSLAGDAQQAAEQTLTTLGLHYTLGTPKTSMTVPAGEVISSSPDSGTLLPGQSVTLVVSAGKPKVGVPAIAAGETFAAYQQALTQLGLVGAQTQTYSNTVPQGDVISVNPAPATSVTVGTTVAVTVSQGPHMVSITDVSNTSVSQAAQELSNEGLSVSGVQGNPFSTVTGTNPPANTSVLYGSSVVLITH